LLNDVSFFGILKYVCDIVVKKFTFAISSPDEFLSLHETTRFSIIYIHKKRTWRV